MKSKKACTLLLYFYVLFCLPSTHLRFVFSSQKPTFRVPTHISRAESTELEEEAKKKERKENNGFYFFLLILIKERKKERKPESRIYLSRGKGQKTPEYSPQSGLSILLVCKNCMKKNDFIVGMSTCFKNIFGDGPIKVAHSFEGRGQKPPPPKKQKKKQKKTIKKKCTHAKRQSGCSSTS